MAIQGAAAASPAPRRISNVAIQSLFEVFKARQWVKLPYEAELKADDLIRPILAQHSLTRKQVVYQYVRWREGESGINSAPPIGDQEVRDTVNKHVGSHDCVISESVELCISGPVVNLRQWAEPLLRILRIEQIGTLESRVTEISQLIVEYTPRKGRSGTRAVALEMAINDSRIIFI